ncbi:asparaginase [Fusarium heterosporum]|uniref:asparaginase n=1 Tax=Fusarium heterosporum TaxID=42747 RepID=A0A8H5WGR1_FUSHE|nr:asparaginase [Fusarium heterosporum]
MMTILVLGSGGTVARAGKPYNYESGILSLEEVFQPVVYDKDKIRLEFEPICDGDGVDMSSEDTLRLASQVRSKHDLPGVDAVLGLMGIDMVGSFMTVYTSLPRLRRPFIVSSAQVPATALGADGPRNIGDAIMVAVHPEASDRAAMFVFNGKIMCGPSIRKQSVISKDAFESLPDKIGHVEDGCVHFKRLPTNFPTRVLLLEHLSTLSELPRVKIETLTHDYDPDCIKLLIEHGKVRAFVFEAMGNGYCNSRRGEIKKLLEEHDVIAVICTKTGEPLLKSNASFGIPGGYLPAANLEMLLKICLLTGRSRQEIKIIIHERGCVKLLQEAARTEVKANTFNTRKTAHVPFLRDEKQQSTKMPTLQAEIYQTLIGARGINIAMVYNRDSYQRFLCDLSISSTKAVS